MPFAGTRLGGEERDRLVEQPHDPAVGEPEPADHPQQRRLARAVRTEHRQRLAAVDVDVHVEQHLHRAVAEVEVADLQQRLLGAALFLRRAHPLFLELLDHAPHVALGEPRPVEHEARTEHGEERQRRSRARCAGARARARSRPCGAPTTNAPMNIELTNAPKPCARVCGGMTAWATGRIEAIAPTTHANPSAPRTAVAATEWVHHPTSARLNPRSRTADSVTARCGARRKARPVRRPTSGVSTSAGSAIAASRSPRSVARIWKWPSQPEVEPDPPADEPEAHRQHADAHVAQRRDLAEPGERVQRGEVLGADLAVVVEDLFHLGATPTRVGKTAGGEREDGGERGDHEEGDPPLVAAVEDAHAERHQQRPDHEAGRAHRHVRGEHGRAGADGERVGEEGGLHRHRREQADAGEREARRGTPSGRTRRPRAPG